MPFFHYSCLTEIVSLAKWPTFAVIFVVSSVIETKLSPVKHSSCCFNYSRQLKEELRLMLDRKLTWNSSRLSIKRWNEVIDPIYSAVSFNLLHHLSTNYDYTIYNYKCICVITSTQSPKQLRNPELVNVLMVCTRNGFFTARKEGNLYQNWYMIWAVNYISLPCINEFQVRPWSKRIKWVLKYLLAGQCKCLITFFSLCYTLTL